MARTLDEDGHDDLTFATIVTLAYGVVLRDGSTDCVLTLNFAGVAYLNSR